MNGREHRGQNSSGWDIVNRNDSGARILSAANIKLSLQDRDIKWQLRHWRAGRLDGGVPALDGGDYGRRQSVELDRVHGMIEAVSCGVENAVESGFGGLAIDAGMSRLKCLPQDVEILVQRC